MGSQQFCLKWNNHQSNLLVVFDQLLQNEAFVDVTLACEGLSLKAHKMVLSACSPYFQSLFLENPCKHPIVILNSMRYCDLKAIIDFMYKGEVNVSQEQLSALLKTAEMLKVKGLAEVTNQTTQTLMTQSVVVPPLDSRASPTLPEQVGQPPPSSTSQRSSVSPPPKRKKLRSSAVSSSASSPQTPSMSTASLSSQKAELHNANLDTKIVPPMVLPLVTDLSQDGHSNHDHQADQNLEQNQDHLMDAPPEISEDHSSTSNLTEKGFEKSGGDQTSQDPHSHMLDLAFQNLPSTPSTSGIQTATGATGLSSKSSKKSWTLAHLMAALQAVQSGHMSMLKAASTFGIPKSSLHDYVSGRTGIRLTGIRAHVASSSHDYSEAPKKSPHKWRQRKHKSPIVQTSVLSTTSSSESLPSKDSVPSKEEREDDSHPVAL